MRYKLEVNTYVCMINVLFLSRITGVDDRKPPADVEAKFDAAQKILIRVNPSMSFDHRESITFRFIP